VVKRNKRLLLHIPVGAVNLVLLQVHPVLAVIFFLGFMIYELNEDWRIKDFAFVDIAGYLWGLALSGLAKFLMDCL